MLHAVVWILEQIGRAQFELHVYEPKVTTSKPWCTISLKSFSWRKSQKEEIHNLYFSPTIVRTIKSSTMKKAGACSKHGGKKFLHSFGREA